ncbi:hypothetical protein F383_29211 [Gossypium arboreum]|uniref:Uncharacterized protein n=1 Tax=Gossypium arboreum TaxID=29729 RepID=A0A0B0MS39_GOSAR|nr:hypothetical protein F383_29211 [Gossypium arboreum]
MPTSQTWSYTKTHIGSYISYSTHKIIHLCSIAYKQ